MKLATVNPEINLDIKQIYTKEVRTINLMVLNFSSFAHNFIDLFPNFFVESSFKIWGFISPWLLPADGYLPAAVATRDGNSKLT